MVRQFGHESWMAQRWGSIMPARFAWAKLDDCTDAPARRALSEWSSTVAPGNLCLFGPVGVGKSHLAVAACRQAHDAGLQVRFYPVVELLDLLRPGGPEGILYELAEVDRLIIDDLGSERPTEWTAERLYALVNRRWLEERPTIITANGGPPELREAVGERMYSRIVGSGATVLRLTGNDRRRA